MCVGSRRNIGRATRGSDPLAKPENRSEGACAHHEGMPRPKPLFDGVNFFIDDSVSDSITVSRWWSAEGYREKCLTLFSIGFEQGGGCAQPGWWEEPARFGWPRDPCDHERSAGDRTGWSVFAS